MPLEKIEKKTLRQIVYEKLKETIISADLLPGEPISIRKLASMLDVSPMPVREALWQLESEKVVVIRSNKSIHVSELDRAELNEIMDIRLSLETLAAEKACDLRPDSALEDLKKLVDNMWSSINDHKLYLKINRQFHFGIYKLAESPILLSLIDGLWARIGPYFNIHVIDAEHLRSVNTPCHEQMLAALRDRDKASLRQALVEELIATRKRVLPLLEVDIRAKARDVG